jgi:Na+/proline symporter
LSSQVAACYKNKVAGLVSHCTASVMGGLRAVLWTDTFQTFVVIGGLIGIITIGSSHLGGFGLTALVMIGIGCTGSSIYYQQFFSYIEAEHDYDASGS